MTVQELIERLQEYPSDMVVEVLTDWEGEGYDEELDAVWEPITAVEMINNHGNVIRIW